MALIQPVKKMSNPNPGNVYVLFLNFIISIFKFQVYVLKLRRQGKKLSKLMYIVAREVFPDRIKPRKGKQGILQINVRTKLMRFIQYLEYSTRINLKKLINLPHPTSHPP